jgi:hypothetical protein
MSSGVQWWCGKPPEAVSFRGQSNAIGAPSIGLSLGRVASPQSPPPFHPMRNNTPKCFGQERSLAPAGEKELSFLSLRI